MMSVGISEEPFPDERLAKLATIAALLFCFIEILSLVSIGNLWVSTLYLPAFISALFAIRTPAQIQNHKQTIALFACVFVAVSAGTYLGHSTSEGLLLVLVASFVLMSSSWAVAYCLFTILAILFLTFVFHENEMDGLAIVRSLTCSLVLIVLSHALVSRLLLARREANLGRRVDVSTGLANRSALVEEMAAAVEGYRRYSLDISAICIRTTELESWQAQYGSSKSALVLEELVSIWQSRIRNTDRLFRYGNDVFVVLLPNTNQNSASKLELDLRRASEVYDFSHGEGASLAITVCAVKAGQTWEQWLSDMLCIPKPSANR